MTFLGAKSGSQQCPEHPPPVIIAGPCIPSEACLGLGATASEAQDSFLWDTGVWPHAQQELSFPTALSLQFLPKSSAPTSSPNIFIGVPKAPPELKAKTGGVWRCVSIIEPQSTLERQQGTVMLQVRTGLRQSLSG